MMAVPQTVKRVGPIGPTFFSFSWSLTALPLCHKLTKVLLLCVAQRLRGLESVHTVNYTTFIPLAEVSKIPCVF